MFTVILTVDIDGTLTVRAVNGRQQNLANAVQIYRMNKSQARLDPPMGLGEARMGRVGIGTAPGQNSLEVHENPTFLRISNKSDHEITWILASATNACSQRR
jgi:hypothetical protein